MQALADTLDKEAGSLMQTRGGGEVPASSRARASLRKLAADWLRTPDADAPGTARKTLLGRTIALRRSEFDTAVGPDEPAPARAFVVEALAHDLEHHADLPDISAIERFLRDALWPLAGDAAPSAGAGWVVVAAPATTQRPLREFAALTDMGSEDLILVEVLEKRLDAAAIVPAYAASATDLRRATAVTLNALAHGNAKLLAPAVRELVRKELVALLTTLGDGPADTAARLAAADRLRRLALLCDALVKAAGLDTTNTTVRILRSAVEEFATAGKWRDDPGTGPRLRLVAKIIDRAAPDAVLTDEKTLARQFRTAMRVIEPLARQSGLQTLEIAPRILAGSDAISDPAVLGALTAHARRLNDVRLLRAAADAIATPGKGEPEIPAPRRFLAERFVTLGQDLGRPDKRDLAISELRDLSSQVRAWKTIAGESELRAAADDKGWHDATDSRLRELAAAIDSTRASWVGSWTSPKAMPASAVVRRLAMIRDNLPLIADAAAALDVGAGDSRLNSWPGWELSPDAAAWLVQGLADPSRALAGAIISGSDDAATAPRKKLAGEFALALTIGRLERRARALGIATLPDAPHDALAQVIFGPAPYDAWLFDAREELATMCRAIEEAAAASEDPKRQGDVARFKSIAERAARAVSLRLDAEDSGDH